jgi:3'-phosphoadenosine 5'-phosphosulfate sulfotransferase (PAPS reductase)/FAD synthetase
MKNSRVVVWFSCGAASAVAAKLAVEKYGDRCTVVYCDTMASEHPDNQRFFDDVQRWIGRPILKIRSEEYASVDEVFEQRRYMAGIAGAICTTEMKKVPRLKWQQADDLHIWGYTLEEQDRIEQFEQNNPELFLEWILRDNGIGKRWCLYLLEQAGIKLPEMYALGFEHNNCIGCVKATSPTYWQRVRRHFPEVFARRVVQSREIKARLVRIEGERRFLDELPADESGFVWDFALERAEQVSCGPMCATN